MRAKQIDFSEGKIIKNIVSVAAPMLVAQILNLLYNIVDRIYIGRIPETGTMALGALGLCFPIIAIITAFTNMYGSGGSPLCSIERGKGNTEEAENLMNTSFYLLLGTGIALTVIGIAFCRPLLHLFGASEASMKYAEPYMRIYMCGTVFSMIGLGLNPFINAQGFANVGMTTIFLGAIFNIVLDPIFIFVLHMGVSGAALATIISQFISAVFVLRFLTSGKAELSLKFRRGMFSRKRALNIVGLGSASFVMQCTNSLVQICANNMLGVFGGDIYISAMTIVNSVRQVLDTPVHAMTEGASPVMSYNYGSGNYKGVKKAIVSVTIAAVGYTAVVWVLILLLPAMFIGVFNSDETLLGVTIPALHTYFFAFVFQALMYSAQSVFKSLNKKKQAIFFSLLRKVIIVVPLTFLLPHIGGLGVTGVFAAEPISNAIGGLACFLTMLATVWKELGKSKSSRT